MSIACHRIIGSNVSQSVVVSVVECDVLRPFHGCGIANVLMERGLEQASHKVDIPFVDDAEIAKLVEQFEAGQRIW